MVTMRAPNLEIDGWCLDDGEVYHRDAPDTFWIPDLRDRETLKVGDNAKLIFQISVDDPDEPIAFERMWVAVSERVPGGYIGLLDNEPFAIAENKDFWLGSELPFEPRHVIAIDRSNDGSVAYAKKRPLSRWPRDD